MNELITLAQVGPFHLTSYGLNVMLGAALAIVLTCCLGRKAHGLNACLSLSLAAASAAVLGARVFYCATMYSSFLSDYVEQGGLRYMLQLWEGGYNLYGGVLGGAAGILLYAKATGRKPLPLLDLAAPGGALALCFIRLAEYNTLQGMGPDMEAEILHFFPVAMRTIYDSWAIPVFFWEALAALLIMVVSLAVRPWYEGRTAGNFIVLLGTTQIILDSLRADEFIRFGFVHFNMVAAAVTVFFILVLRMRRAARENRKGSWQTVRCVLFFLAVAIVILLEFALDKSSIENWILYLIMLASLCMMTAAVLVEHPKA